MQQPNSESYKLRLILLVSAQTIDVGDINLFWFSCLQSLPCSGSCGYCMPLIFANRNLLPPYPLTDRKRKKLTSYAAILARYARYTFLRIYTIFLYIRIVSAENTPRPGVVI